MITPPKYPKKERLVVPEGMHQAVLYDVWDVGFQKTTYKGEVKVVPQVILAFEIAKLISFGKFQGKRYTISRKYTFSLGEKANLAKDIEAWRLKKLSQLERDTLDLETLIGKNCLLGITHTEKDGVTYAHISSIAPLMEGLPTLTPENPRGKPNWVVELIGKAIDPNTAPIPESSDVRERDAQNAAEEENTVICDENGEEIPF